MVTVTLFISNIKLIVQHTFLSLEMEKNMIKSRFKSVCVFCGSSTGKRDCYRDAAIELGKELVSRRLNLVYGGGSIGLMGLVSQAVHDGGGHVLGGCICFLKHGGCSLKHVLGVSEMMKKIVVAAVECNFDFCLFLPKIMEHKQVGKIKK